MAVLKETVRELVAQELGALLFLSREAFIEENGGRKNGTYPRLLETPYGRVKLRVPRDRKGAFGPPYSPLTPEEPWTWRTS